MLPQLTEITNKIAEYSDRKLAKFSEQDFNSVRALIASYVDELVTKISTEDGVNILSESRNNILHIAAKFGDVEQMKRVVEFVNKILETYVGMDASAVDTKDVKYYVNLRDENFFTPLHYAAKNGWVDAVIFLLECGAEKNPKASPKDREWMPIHYAAKGGHLEVVKTLLSAGIDKEIKTSFGLTPLVIAAEFGHTDLLQFLIGVGANKNVKTTAENHSMTALHYGAVGGYSDVVLLLMKEGVDKEVKTSSGLTALHFAVSAGNINVAEILLINGADIFDKTNSGHNALHVAASKGQDEMVSFLLQWGIDELDIALSVAKAHSNKVIVQKIELYQKAIKNLFNLKNLPADFVEVLKNFTKQDVHEAKIILAEGVSFNGYGVFNLKQEVGIFSKRRMTLSKVVEEKKSHDLSDALHALEKTIGLYKV